MTNEELSRVIDEDVDFYGKRLVCPGMQVDSVAVIHVNMPVVVLKTRKSSRIFHEPSVGLSSASHF
jgi:hypothetical protein